MRAVQAIGFVARSLRRRAIGSVLLIAAVAGVAGGLATGLVAGALRTSSAGDRFIAEAHVIDLLVASADLTPEQAQQIRELPGIRGAALVTSIAMLPRGSDYLNLVASMDGRHGVDVDVSRIVRGRAADPDAADEVVLSEVVASTLGVEVGDTVRYDSFTPDQVAAMRATGEDDPAAPEPLGPTVDLEVVGISRHPADLTSDDPLNFFTTLPPGFLRAYGGQVGEWGYRFVAVDIGPSPSAAAEEAAAEAIRGIVGPGAELDEAGEHQSGPLLTTLDFVARGMVVLAAAIGVAGVGVAGLMVARTAARAGAEVALLRSLGMTSRSRAGVIVAALAPAAAGAGLVTAVVATASSAFMPFGLAGRAEPAPGIRVDVPVLLVGIGATVLVLLALTAISAFAVTRRTATVQPVGRARSKVLRLDLPVGAVCGLHFALGGGRRGSRSASRTGMAGVALATAAGAAALVLGASIDHLFSTPAAYGWTWDYLVSHGAAERLVDDPNVESVGLVTVAPLVLDGRPVYTRGIESLKGELPVRIVDGRHAESGEIVLGARTMADLDVGIGDTIVADGPAQRRELRVVGEAVFAGVVDVPEAGWGAAMPRSALDELGVGSSDVATATRGVIALAPGVEADAAVAQLTEADEDGQPPAAAEEPIELARLDEIEAFPRVLTAFLAALGLVAAGHAVVVTARQRRPELAVLRAMGMSGRNVYQAMFVVGAVLGGIGILIGVPVGVAAGQLLWREIAAELGVVVAVDVPWTAMLLAALTAAAVVSMLAFVPARTATQVRPAVALRAE